MKTFLPATRGKEGLKEIGEVKDVLRTVLLGF